MIKYPNGQPYKKNEISKRKKSDSEISISSANRGMDFEKNFEFFFERSETCVPAPFSDLVFRPSA